MSVPVRLAFAVPTPQLLGVLIWWAIMLAAPVILIRRVTRRRGGAMRRNLLRRRAGRQAAADTGGDTTPTSARVRPSKPFSDVASPSAGAPNGDSPDLAALASRQRRAQHEGDTHAALRSAAKLSPGTLEPLCRYVDFRRRLELAVSELERQLASLPQDRWRIEPYPLTGERRNTLLALGATGVFVLSATYAPGHWDDVVAVNRLASKVQELLPGYSGEVQPAICHPFTSLEPRIWHRADDHGDWIGAWLVGGDLVIEWLGHFGRVHGLSVADLDLFDRLSKPNWLKPAIPTPATWPAVPGAGHE